jgi:hypothetical protein
MVALRDEPVGIGRTEDGGKSRWSRGPARSRSTVTYLLFDAPMLARTIEATYREARLSR